MEEGGVVKLADVLEGGTVEVVAGVDLYVESNLVEISAASVVSPSVEIAMKIEARNDIYPNL